MCTPAPVGWGKQDGGQVFPLRLVIGAHCLFYWADWELDFGSQVNTQAGPLRVDLSVASPWIWQKFTCGLVLRGLGTRLGWKLKHTLGFSGGRCDWSLRSLNVKYKRGSTAG